LGISNIIISEGAHILRDSGTLITKREFLGHNRKKIFFGSLELCPWEAAQNLWEARFAEED
jgi:hypothetical protein